VHGTQATFRGTLHGVPASGSIVASGRPRGHVEASDDEVRADFDLEDQGETTP